MKKLISLFLLLFLCGCGAVSPAPDNKNTPPALTTQGSGEGYPVQPLIEDTAYPAPAFQTETLGPTVTADATKGLVKGAIYLNGKPVGNAILSLADVLKAENGEEYTAVERSKSQKTTTQPDGSFSFRNVPPGRYALVYSIVVESYLLYKPGKTDEAILLDVAEGQDVDLGKLDFDELPMLSK